MIQMGKVSTIYYRSLTTDEAKKHLEEKNGFLQLNQILIIRDLIAKGLLPFMIKTKEIEYLPTVEATSYVMYLTVIKIQVKLANKLFNDRQSWLKFARYIKGLALAEPSELWNTGNIVKKPFLLLWEDTYLPKKMLPL